MPHFLSLSSLPESNAVMWVIGLVALLLWGLIIQSYWRITQLRSSGLVEQLVHTLSGYADLDSTLTKLLHMGWRSEISLYLGKGGGEIRLLIRLLPMLGLLGTVDGMVDCFANLNHSNVLEAVSSGISQAMFTTLAGLLVALSGMYFSYHLQRQQQSLLRHITHELETYENQSLHG